MKDYVIIVAGGKGLRMGGEIPKQFLPIGGRPILMRTLERFREYSADLQIILVLPKAQQDYWQELCKEYHFKVEYQLANGGETRFHSVQNGLALVPDDAQGPRDEYRLVQTPQTFDIQLLKAANRQPYNDHFTDDASVVEAFGFDITLVEGNRENIKITTPYDMTVAEALLKKEKPTVL